MRYFNKPVKVIVANISCKGRKYDLVLCEEGIDSETLRDIVQPICHQAVGYVTAD